MTLKSIIMYLMMQSKQKWQFNLFLKLKLIISNYNKMSELQLSIMTLDGKFDNVKFDKETAIHGLYLYKNIIKIISNYGSISSEKYEEIFKPKPKSNRGRKPKPKKKSLRKIQGTGECMNSQISFVILSQDETYSYQIKLFSNGRFQIPGIKKDDEFDTIVKPELDLLIEFINENKTLKKNVDKPVNIIFTKPILRNYKFSIFNEPNKFLDLNKLRNIFQMYKDNNNTEIKIYSIKFHSERFAGLLVKFSTPEEYTENKKINKFIEIVRRYVYINNKKLKKVKSKETTCKIFRSSKINIDSANNTADAIILKDILSKIIEEHKDEVIYVDEHAALPKVKKVKEPKVKKIKVPKVPKVKKPKKSKKIINDEELETKAPIPV